VGWGGRGGGGASRSSARRRSGLGSRRGRRSGGMRIAVVAVLGRCSKDIKRSQTIRAVRAGCSTATRKGRHTTEKGARALNRAGASPPLFFTSIAHVVEMPRFYELFHASLRLA